MAGNLFISYRREDAAAHARNVELSLKQSFGDGHVFMDVDNIAPGDDFSDTLSRMLRRCKVLLVIIGPRWLDILKEKERAHFQNDDNDYIRIEVGQALRDGKRVIPVLVGGARMPDQMELYGELVALSRCQAVELRHNHFNHDLDRLVTQLYDIVGRPLTKQPWDHWLGGAVSLAGLAGLYALLGPTLQLPGFQQPAIGKAATTQLGRPAAATPCSYEPFEAAALPGGAATVITLTSNPAGPCQLGNLNAQGQPPADLAVLRRPRSGEATILPRGVVSYMPPKDFVGLDHFVAHSTSEPYQLAVVISVLPPGQAVPRTTAAEIETVCQVAPFGGAALPGGSGTVIKVRNTGQACRLSNHPRQGQPDLDLVVVRQPRNGAVEIGAQGIVAYTPRPGFTGRDNFAFRAETQPYAVSVNVVVVGK